MSSSDLQLARPPQVVTRAPGCLWFVAVGALLVAVISLVINVAMAAALLNRRAALLVAVDQSIIALDEASRHKIAFNLPISQTVDWEGDIPFQQNFDFPIEANVRINTTIRVPVNLGLLGTQVVDVPVDTTVPINTSLPVRIDQTFHVKTRIPVRLDVPIELAPQEPPWRDWLNGAREWLVQLRDQI